MKYLLALFLLIPLFFVSREASAFTQKIDSVYADSIYLGVNYGALDITDPKSSLGLPDKKYAAFNHSTSTLDVGFQNHAHTTLLPIKANSKIIIWGQKDNSVDTSAGQFIFVQAAPDGTILQSTKPILLNEGPDTITVPSGEFTYLEFSLAGSEKGHGAKSYLLDAIALVQDTTPVVSVLSQPLLIQSITSYPNPFVQNTTIHFELETPCHVQLAVIDGLGREVDRIQSGYLESGIHEIPLAIKTQGFYFVRLFINGQPVGNPLKITSR